jgi:phosphatidylglycerol:prolipoprotein diacylglycerol transferase
VPKFDWNLKPYLFQLGGWELRYYSLMFVLVFLGGYFLLNWQIRRGGGHEEEAGDFIIYGVLGVLVGARLGHVLFYDLDHALEDPLWVFKIWTGGLASHGAALGLTVAMYLFTRRRGVPFLEGADRFAFSAALGAALVRLGNFFNSEIVGRATDQTWGVRFLRHDQGPDAPYRHPSQLYEFALGLFTLLALYVADRAFGKERRPRGALISLFFVLYFSGRFLVEFVKEYQPGELGVGLTTGQKLSLPGILIGVVGLVWSFKQRLPAGWISSFDAEAEDEEDEDEEEGNQADAGDEPDASDEHSDKRKSAEAKPKRSLDPDVEEEFASKGKA